MAQDDEISMQDGGSGLSGYLQASQDVPVVERRACPEGPPEVHPGQVVQVVVALAEAAALLAQPLEPVWKGERAGVIPKL